jgi:hypothetical protein
MHRLTGATGPVPSDSRRAPLREWLLSWIDKDVSHLDEMDSLPGVMWHLSDAWKRRDEPNIVLVHYDDLAADLDGEMRRIAERLDVTVPGEIWPALVEAATFANMRSKADVLTPNHSGILKDNAAFFRRGSSGSAREILTDEEIAHYRERIATMAPALMLEWLHR